jgi:hypothetical protein
MCVWKSGFSPVATIKKHYQSKVKVEQEMKAAFLSMKSVLQELCKSKQVHPSH